jgi:hypothetical protein
VEGSCEYYNEPCGSIKGGQFLRDCYVPKNDYAPWSLFGLYPTYDALLINACIFL